MLAKLVMDAKRYALLLNSVARQGTGSSKRPLTPIECAESIKRMIEEGDTHEQVAERLDLGKPSDGSSMYKKRDTTMVMSFLKLLEVSQKSRDLIGWGTEDYPKIPFSTVSQMASFSHEDQDAILQSVFDVNGKKKLGKEDVKKIRKWRNDNPGTAIQECISKILDTKPVIETTHMVVCEIQNNVRKIIELDTEYRKTLLKILRKKIKGEFYAVDVGKSVIAISMDADAYQAFRESQHVRKVSYTQFLNGLLEDNIG